MGIAILVSLPQKDNEMQFDQHIKMLGRETLITCSTFPHEFNLVSIRTFYSKKTSAQFKSNVK